MCVGVRGFCVPRKLMACHGLVSRCTTRGWYMIAADLVRVGGLCLGMEVTPCRDCWDCSEFSH